MHATDSSGRSFTIAAKCLLKLVPSLEILTSCELILYTNVFDCGILIHLILTLDLLYSDFVALTINFEFTDLLLDMQHICRKLVLHG